MSKYALLFAVGCIYLSFLPALAQERIDLPTPAAEIEVRFEQRTLLDERGVHVEDFEEAPEENLKLPDVDLSAARFLTVYYSRDVAEDDYRISILILPDSTGETLYIDLDNDEDLTSDEAIFFPKTEDELVFWITAPSDPAQRTGRILQRIPRTVRENPELTDWFKGMFDEDGNLKPPLTTMFDIKGKKGAFYFDDRISLSRGILAQDSLSHPIGIYDYTENGRFDDEKDLLLLDFDGNGTLSMQDPQQAVKLHDVFELGDTRYRLTYIDPYGRGIRLVEVEDAPTNTYLREWEEYLATADVPIRARKAVASTFWNLTLETIAGDSLRLGEYRGRHVLLNVWGEWCGPCLAELPALVASYHKYAPDRVMMIGLLHTGEVEAARAVMRQEGVEWPQVMLNAALRERFGIGQYPTNLLLLPDGETYIEAGMVNEKFFDTNVQ